jgi:hypothetical protein
VARHLLHCPDSVRGRVHQRAGARRLFVHADPGGRRPVLGRTTHSGIETALGWLSLLRVHLNLAFYLAFSVLLLFIWLFVIVVVDHFTWWRFSPGQVIEEHRIGQATGHAYNTEGMVVRRAR